MRCMWLILILIGCLLIWPCQYCLLAARSPLIEEAALYNCCYLVLSLEQLNHPLSTEHKTALLARVNALLQPDGTYREEPELFPPIYSTYLAVSLIRALGGSILDADTTIDYLAKVLETEGVLAFSTAYPGELDLSETLYNTFEVLRILNEIGAAVPEFSLLNEVLNHLWQEERCFSTDSLRSLTSEGGLVIKCLALLEVNPADLPSLDTHRHWIEHSKEYLVQVDEFHAPLLGVFLDLIEIGEYLGIDFFLGNYLEEKVSLLELPTGGYAFEPGSSIMDPYATYLAVRTLDYLETPQRSKQLLIETIMCMLSELQYYPSSP